MSNFTKQFRPRLLLASVFTLIAMLVGWDLLSDQDAAVDTLHLVIESLVLLIAAGSGLFLLLRDWQHRRRLGELASQIEKTRADSARWRTRYQDTISGLSQAIQAQFTEWKLSAAEARVLGRFARRARSASTKPLRVQARTNAAGAGGVLAPAQHAWDWFGEGCGRNGRGLGRAGIRPMTENGG